MNEFTNKINPQSIIAQILIKNLNFNYKFYNQKQNHRKYFIILIQAINLTNLPIQMKNNFKEQFEDSQANFSQIQHNNSNQYPGFQDKEQGFPIQLARFKESSKMIELDEKALDIIAECDLPVGFVTFVGKYRIGKSCLLNRMLGLPGDGFKVSNTTRQCTKGIWMWSKPFYSAQHQCYLFFMDTQGTQALQKQTETDIKLFTLNCLLSTYLVFNSIGNIDERSIEQLNLVTSLSKNILISNDMSNKQNEEYLYKYMPKFLWLLRDFTLQLRDANGRLITPSQYLEDCLSADPSSLTMKSYQSESKKIKNQIVKIFKDRDCFTLVRPASEERQLQRLNELPDHALRRDFITGINKLKETIFKNAEPKYFEGQALMGGSIVAMLEAFVQSMNNGAIPKIKTAWEQIAQDEGAFAFNRGLQKYNQSYSSYFVQDQPFASQVIHQILSDMREQALQQFNKSLSQPNQLYHNKLKQYLKSKQKNIIQVNKQLTEVKNVELLKDLSMPLMKKIQSGGYKGKKKNLTKDVDDLVKTYNSKAIGETKGDMISEFLTTLNPIIFSLAEDQANKQNMGQSKLSNQAMIQFQKRQKAMEQQLLAMKNQVQSKDAILKKRQKQLKDANQQIKKRQAKGCCEIM